MGVVLLVVAVNYNDGQQTHIDYSFNPSAAKHVAVGLFTLVLNDLAAAP